MDFYGLFVLPESLAREHRAAFSWRRANPLGALALLREHRGLFGLVSINFLGQLAHVALPSIVVLYAGYRYGWGTRTVGLMLALVGVCMMIVQGGLVGKVNKAIGERRALLIGTLCGAASFAIMGLAPVGTVFFVSIPMMALWGFAGPATQSLMTRLVSRSEQGRLQGANSSMVGIANLIGPSLFTLTFAQAIGPLANWQVPGAPFLVSAMLLILATALALWVTRKTNGVREPAPPS